MNSRLTPWDATIADCKIRVFEDDDEDFKRIRPGFVFVDRVRHELHVRRSDLRVLNAALHAIVVIKRIMERSNR